MEAFRRFRPLRPINKLSGCQMCLAAAVSDPYPRFSHYPRNVGAPMWVEPLVNAFRSCRTQIDTILLPKGISSDDVLKALRPALTTLGYEVEAGKRADQKVRRPVLFGDEGVPRVMYEIDAFHDELGIAVEVEAGRGAANNADYRDIVRTSLILDSRYLVLAMPIAYKFTSSGKQTSISAYANSRDQLDAIYASQRLRLPFEGILLVGY